MFTGIGGFEYGIQQALPNAECVGYSEIDKYAIQTYESHFKHKNYGDATKIKPEKLPDFDMLCGGFPCQAFSIAGKRRGFQDTRGTLFFDIARIVEVKRPKIVLLENVKGLLNHNKGETFRVIIQTLSELGYDIQWMVLNSKFFGVPQNRERVFIIGSLRGTSRPEILPFSRTDTEVNQEGINHPTLTEAIGRQGSSKEYIRSCQTILDINQAQRVYSTEGTSITIKGLGGGQGAKTGLYAISNSSPRELGWKEQSPTLQARDYKDPKIVAIRGRPRYNEKGERELKFYEYDEMPTLSQNCAMGDQKNMIARAVLTPDRADKRQNGRRFKEDGEEMFTLTGQDLHGVAIRVKGDLDKREVYFSDESQTISANPTSDNLPRIFDEMQIRRLTPTECERLQGFPDGWTEGVSDTQRYKQCGNAVTTKVIKSIVEKLIGGKFTQGATPSFNKGLKVRKSEISSPKSNPTDLTSPNPNIKLNSCKDKPADTLNLDEMFIGSIV